MEGDAGSGLSELDVAVRAWAIRETPDDDDSRRGRTGTAARVPDAFLVLDTETTTTADQRLLFGCWRYYRTHNVITKDTYPRAKNRSVYVALAGQVSRREGNGP